MTEDARAVDVSITEDGHTRIVILVDSGFEIIELDRENALKFAHNLLIMALGLDE